MFFYHIMSVLMMLPLLVLVPIALGIWFYTMTRRGVHLASALLWAAYGVYEILMQARILCSGECNIRVDLLVIYPLLVFLLLASLVSIARSRQPSKPVNTDNVAEARQMLAAYNPPKLVAALYGEDATKRAAAELAERCRPEESCIKRNQNVLMTPVRPGFCPVW